MRDKQRWQEVKCKFSINNKKGFLILLKNGFNLVMTKNKRKNNK